MLKFLVAICLIALTHSPSCLGEEFQRKSVSGLLYHYPAGIYFRADAEVSRGYWPLYKIESDDPQMLKILEKADHATKYTVDANFFKNQLLAQGRRFCRAQIFNLYRAPVLAHDDEETGSSSQETLYRITSSDPLDIFAAELAPITLTDALLHARASDYRKFLKDSNVLARIRLAQGGSEAILAIRRLALADILFENFPEVRTIATSSEVGNYLDAAARLWDKGAHGVLRAIDEVVTSHLDIMAASDFSCDYLLSHFGEDEEDQILDLKHKVIISLQSIKVKTHADHKFRLKK